MLKRFSTPTWSTPPTWARYAAALVAPCLAVLGQLIMTQTVGYQMPLLLLIMATAAVAFWGGLGPGLLCTATCATLLTISLRMPGSLPIQPLPDGQVPRLVVFSLTGIIMSLMSGSLHHTRNRLRQANDQLLLDSNALRENAQLLRSISDNSSDIIFAKDLEGRINFLNRAGCEAVGLPSSQILGRTDAELHGDPQQTAFYRACDLRVMGEGRTETVEELYTVPATGITRYVLTTKTPRLDEKGQIIGVVGVVHDITAYKAAEDALRVSEERLRLAAEAGGFGTYLRDLVTNQIWWSDELKQIAGLPSLSPIPPGYPEQLIHPDDQARVAAARQVWFGKGGEDFYEDEHRWQMADGSVRWIYVKGCTVYDKVTGQPLRSMGAVLDITSRKAAEEALRESKVIAESARLSAERAKEIAEAASRAKDDFLAALSHELRNPLNPVLLLASEWEREPGLAPAARADWSLVRKNVALEARLIDDLLDLTSIARGKLAVTVTKTDMEAILREALGNVRADWEAKSIRLSLDFDAGEKGIWADAVRLQQIFWNVLKNAIKFTPEGGTIAVRTRTLSPQHRVTVQVDDSGIGMNSEELDRVFDAFSQGDHADASGAHRFGGLGLGLAITRQLVLLHNGRILASSLGSGQGSTFSLEFPLVRSEFEKPPKLNSREEGDSRSRHQVRSRMDVPEHTIRPWSPGDFEPLRRRLLLVEDHEATRLTLSRLLVRRGYEVTSAGTLAEARNLVADQRFELLVSDLGLPDGNGHDLMAELQKLHLGSLRGIALSGYGMEEDINRSRDAGFSEHLTKPVEFQVLEDALRRVSA